MMMIIIIKHTHNEQHTHTASHQHYHHQWTFLFFSVLLQNWYLNGYGRETMIIIKTHYFGIVSCFHRSLLYRSN